MAHFVVDKRDRVAQRLTWAAAETYTTDRPDRFVVVEADNGDEAVRAACGGETLKVEADDVESILNAAVHHYRELGKREGRLPDGEAALVELALKVRAKIAVAVRLKGCALILEVR